MKHTNKSLNSKADIYDMNEALTALFDEMDKTEKNTAQVRRDFIAKQSTGGIIKTVVAIESVSVINYLFNKILNKPRTRYESLVR